MQHPFYKILYAWHKEEKNAHTVYLLEILVRKGDGVLQY